MRAFLSYSHSLRSGKGIYERGMTGFEQLAAFVTEMSDLNAELSKLTGKEKDGQHTMGSALS